MAAVRRIKDNRPALDSSQHLHASGRTGTRPATQTMTRLLTFLQCISLSPFSSIARVGSVKSRSLVRGMRWGTGVFDQMTVSSWTAD